MRDLRIEIVWDTNSDTDRVPPEEVQTFRERERQNEVKLIHKYNIQW